MRIDERFLDFFQRPLMCILAGADATGRPAAGRGVGVHLAPDRETLEVIFSAWQWPQLTAALRQTGKIAATFVSPSDYVSFQLKGRASLHEPGPQDLRRAEAFMAAATAELQGLGVAQALIVPWLTARQALVARFAIAEIYVQTPGPLAGMLAAAAGGAR